MPGSVIVNGTSARAWREEELRGAAGAAEHVDEPDRDSLGAGAARGEGGELLHEALRSPVEARGECRLVGAGDDHGLDAGNLGRAQDVPASVQVRVHELLGEDLGPVHVLVGGEVEDDVRPRPRQLRLQPAGVAHVAERMGDSVRRIRAAGPAVGDQRRLVTIEQRDLLGTEAEQQRRERAADRAATSGDEHAPAAEDLLELEHRGHWVALSDDVLPVEGRVCWRENAGRWGDAAGEL